MDKNVVEAKTIDDRIQEIQNELSYLEDELRHMENKKFVLNKQLLTSRSGEGK